jgi:hypothetical protein
MLLQAEDRAEFLKWLYLEHVFFFTLQSMVGTYRKMSAIINWYEV